MTGRAATDRTPGSAGRQRPRGRADAEQRRDKWIGPRDARIRLRYGHVEIPWTVGPRSDFDVLNEVLVLKVYGPAPAPAEPRTILDLGSHMGASVLFWRERFPYARIIAVEPDPTSFRRLRRNVGSLPGVDLRNTAIAEEDGVVQFFPARQGWVSSLWGEGQSVTVEGRRFRSLIGEIGQVDVLKVDIEGAEPWICDDWALERVGAIVGEYHHSGDHKALGQFMSQLGKHFDLSVGHTASFIAFSGCASASAGVRGDG